LVDHRVVGPLDARDLAKLAEQEGLERGGRDAAQQR
jgi:hypothetical protein